MTSPTPMELLLLQDINGIGRKNDIVVVRDGFALNHLLPERKALVATPTVRKRYAEQIKRRAEEKELERNLQQQAASTLAGRSVSITRKVTKTGKLYAAVSESDILEALKDQHGIDLKNAKLDIAEPIKATGNFPVTVRIGETTLTLPVSVVKEEVKAKSKK